MASIIKVDQIQTASGGTPTAADLGINTTGSVLQHQFLQNHSATEISTTSSTLTASGLQLKITPKAAGNKIIVRFSTPMSEATTASAAGTGQMYVNGSPWNTGESPGNYQLVYTQSSTYLPIVFGGVWTAADTNEITFEPYFRTSGSGYAFKLFHNGTGYYFDAMEIAG